MNTSLLDISSSSASGCSAHTITHLVIDSISIKHAASITGNIGFAGSSKMLRQVLSSETPAMHTYVTT